MQGLKITRRRLPHWFLEGSIYFVTFVTKRRAPLSPLEQSTVLRHLKRGDGRFYDLFAAIVMPDHVHLLVRPRSGFTLSRVMKGIKGVTAYKLNRMRGGHETVWQHESYDRIVRDGGEFGRELRYMYENPRKKQLTDNPSTYHGWYMNAEKCGFDYRE